MVKKVGPSQAPLPKGKSKPIPSCDDPSGQKGKKGGYPGSMPRTKSKTVK